VNTSYGARPYLFSLYDLSTNKAFGASYRQLEAILEDLIETYDGGFTFDRIVIRHTVHADTDLNNLTVMAQSGEGIPIRLRNGFWLLDILATRGQCLAVAASLWKMYISKTMTVDLDVYRSAKAKFNKTCIERHGALHTVAVAEMLNVQCLLLGCLDSIEFMDPQITLMRPVIYVDCNHAVLVGHESFMPPHVWSWLMYRSSTTFVSKAYVKRAPDQTSMANMTLDIECYRDRSQLPHVEHVPLVAGVHDGASSQVFTGAQCIASSLLHLFTQYPNSNVWSHYGGGYDSHLLLRELLQMLKPGPNQQLSLTDVNGLIISLDVTQGDSKIRFRDSYKFFPRGLDDIAKAFMLGAKEKFDVVNASREELLRPECISYNVNDCVILYRVLQSFREEVISKGWDDPLEFATLSSYTKHMFFRRFYDPEKARIYTLPKWLHMKLETGYRGGINLLKYRGVVHKRLYSYDVNSMYPYVGRNSLPCGIPTYNTHHDEVLTEEFLDGHFGFLNVTIVSTPGHVDPLHGSKMFHKYLFCRFYNTPNQMLFSEELRCGLKLGYRYTVQESVTFSKYPVLKSMFEEAYSHRISSPTEVGKEAWKRIANSGYGFMGFKKYNRKCLAIYGAKHLDTLIFRQYNGQCEFSEIAEGTYLAVENRNVLLGDVNIAIAAAVTSYARVFLYDIQTDVSKYGKVYYMDTDSVCTDVNMDMVPELRTKYRDAEGGSMFGKMKDEHSDDPIVEAVLATNKVYGFRHASGKHTVKVKGVDIGRRVDSTGRIDKQGDKKDTYEELKSCLLREEQFRILASSIIHGKSEKVNNGRFLYERLQETALSLEYHKGIVLPDGNVVPFVMNNGQPVMN
jgi:hypothetical protein